MNMTMLEKLLPFSKSFCCVKNKNSFKSSLCRKEWVSGLTWMFGVTLRDVPEKSFRGKRRSVFSKRQGTRGIMWKTNDAIVGTATSNNDSSTSARWRTMHEFRAISLMLELFLVPLSMWMGDFNYVWRTDLSLSACFWRRRLGSPTFRIRSRISWQASSRRPFGTAIWISLPTGAIPIRIARSYRAPLITDGISNIFFVSTWFIRTFTSVKYLENAESELRWADCLHESRMELDEAGTLRSTGR